MRNRRLLQVVLLFAAVAVVGLLVTHADETGGGDPPLVQGRCVPTQWEYTVFKTGAPAQTELQSVIATMNEHGAVGWEAFNTDFNTDNLLALHNFVAFKRSDCSAHFGSGVPPAAGFMLE